MLAQQNMVIKTQFKDEKEFLGTRLSPEKIMKTSPVIFDRGDLRKDKNELKRPRCLHLYLLYPNKPRKRLDHCQRIHLIQTDRHNHQGDTDATRPIPLHKSTDELSPLVDHNRIIVLHPIQVTMHLKTLVELPMVLLRPSLRVRANLPWHR
jgi:hypothetical protein